MNTNNKYNNNDSIGKGNGNYGRIFIPINERTKPNIGKVYYDLLLEETISTITSPQPEEDKLLQEAGRLFKTGADSNLAMNSIRRLKKGEFKILFFVYLIVNSGSLI